MSRLIQALQSLAALGSAAVVVALALAPANAADMRATENAGLTPIVVGAPQRIEVRPESIRFTTPRQYMNVVVSGFYADGTVQDLTRAAQLTSADPRVARIQEGLVLPTGNGKTVVQITVGSHKASVPVEAVEQQKPEQTSFTFSVQAALTKQGCNQGACHGSPSGKGGFRLSLRAYDPVLDIETLVRESYARRIDPIDPAGSLLLRKPLMEIAHGGGRRLKKDDYTFELLRDWIGQGCKLDAEGAPTCTKIEVYPKNREYFRPAHVQQLLVLGHYSDGTIRDITKLADYLSSDEAVATVDADGFVVSRERGETTVLVRYLDKMETTALTYLEDVPGFKWNQPTENNFIDKLAFEKLNRLQILPAEACSEEEFIRRVHLDVVGRLPTIAETESFLADKASNKRAATIDRLLASEDFIDFWALKWADLLRVRKTKVSEPGVYKFHHWIEQAVRSNLPYDEFARQLVTASGSTLANPAANFYRTAGDVNDCTETASQLFLGIRIQCAKCHNHPFERWTQDNYYGIAAFFTRVQRKKSADENDLVVWSAKNGEITQPRTGKTMKPWAPLKGDVELPPEDDRRDAFAAWLIGPENPFFAKVEVNRIWGNLMGRGIIEPVDDFRESNPAAHPILLEALAKDFIAHKFDRKHVMRTILNSRLYQLSSRRNEFNKDDVKYFSHSRTRMLTAEQLLDAICQVTGVPEKFAGLPAGTTAVQLPSPDVDNYFLKVFGQPARETACQCERSSESNLSQALQMINGPVVHNKLRADNGRIAMMLKDNKPEEEIITSLYLAALA
ncbi:MAG: DUF1549 domain-containing protein, partial [Planctomycetia bacterium]|nr:DUF1549 domain-containing protein [Planctomycetia bacterium]